MAIFKKKLADPYEYFTSINDYKKTCWWFENRRLLQKTKKQMSWWWKNKTKKRNYQNIWIFEIYIKYGEELTELYLKCDLSFLADEFENFNKICIEEYGTNPLYCVCLPGYTWQCGMKYTDIKLQTLQDKDKIFLLVNNFRGGVSSVMGNRYVQSDDNKKILYVDANNLYGWVMSEYLPYDEINFDRNVESEKILNTSDDSDFGYFVEVDLKYPDNKKYKTKNFPFAPENKKINPDDFSDYMKKFKPDTYTQTKKLISDWPDMKNYLIHYRMLKFFVRHGMEVVNFILLFHLNRVSSWKNI